LLRKKVNEEREKEKVSRETIHDDAKKDKRAGFPLFAQIFFWFSHSPARLGFGFGIEYWIWFWNFWFWY
jgi:hypothetical protein